MKKIFSAVLISLLVITSVPAFASENLEAETSTINDELGISESFEAQFPTINTEGENIAEKAPRISWTGTAHLQEWYYSNIVSSTNIIPDQPTVYSHPNNPGNVMLRVVNANGEVVGGYKIVYPGQTVTLDTIDVGQYTIQGRPSITGTYTFTVD